MNAKTIAILNGSARKWEKIVASPDGLDKGASNCPLCDLFYDDSCKDCPVVVMTTIKKDNLPVAVWEGVLKLGKYELPCAVLEDGRRVFTVDALDQFLQYLGDTDGDSTVDLTDLAAFVSGKGIPT